MTQYLVTFSVGPVQGFIAAARRNRDLWSGSWLLSELSKACAKSLYDNPNATLIFPYVQEANQLAVNSDFSVGNKIQAIICTETIDELKQIIQDAKSAIRLRFEIEADKVRATLGDGQIREQIWESQLNDYIEIQSAWAVIEGESGYKTAVHNVGVTLAARKATRDFIPAQITPYNPAYMLPKSSLDGVRETVLLEDKPNVQVRRRLSLAQSEQLDLVGVLKRLGFDEKAEQFTPFTRVCANAWIEIIADKEPAALNQIKEIYERLVGLEIATRVRGNKGIYDKFAFDAQMLYPSRLESAFAQWKGSDDVGDVVCEELKNLRTVLQNLWKKHGEPYRYGVLLLADGDKMGELLDKASTPKQHQRITEALSDFAGQVSTVMRNHCGHCIYAGGDDVLGFVPLDGAYRCADELQKLFFDKLQQAATELGADASPTLSVGLAICHIMTPFGIVRQLAKIAENYAKGDHITDKSQRRNALGIVLSVRSGTDIKLRFGWNDTQRLAFFDRAIGWYMHKQIPSRVAYDIRAIYLYTCDFAREDRNLYQNIQSAELKRMLDQARTDKGDKIAPQVIEMLINQGKEIGLDKLADELIVARWLAAKTQKQLGRE